MYKPILLFVLIVTSFPQNAQGKTLNLCVDGRNWYPFIYINEERQVSGIHFDIVVKALNSLGYDFVINAYPRKQCIDRVINQVTDGMISIAYHSDIVPFFDFPTGAQSDIRSKWRIMQVDYMIVTYGIDPYRFKGDAQNLPEPIRVPRGETIASELRRNGLNVDDGARDDKRNFLKLLRDKNGTVITTSVMAERIIKDLKIIDQVTIHSIPFKSQSYYLGFSNKDRISPEEKDRLWVEITKWRDDFVFMLQLFAKY